MVIVCTLVVASVVATLVAVVFRCYPSGRRALDAPAVVVPHWAASAHQGHRSAVSRRRAA